MEVVVFYKQDKKKVFYNSGRIYLDTAKQVEDLIKAVKKKDPTIQVAKVNLVKPNVKPKEGGKGYWCPYCQTWEYWKSSISGSKVCPICGISERDYYVKSLNHLWEIGMSSKKSKRNEEKARRKKK